MTYVLNLDGYCDIGESNNLMELAQCMATMLWTFPKMKSDALAILYDEDVDVEEGYQEVVTVTERTDDHLTLDVDGILTSFPRPCTMTQ